MLPEPMTPEDVNAFFDAHWTARHFAPTPMPPEHLDAILHAAQRAPTDATAQMYSFVRLRDPALRGWLAQATGNPHLAGASEAFVVCADVHRLRLLLARRGFGWGEWPATAVHFATGDAVMAGQNLLTAAELLGYRGCWIGGVLSALPEVVERLALPEGVLPFAGLVLGTPTEAPKHRPRLPRELVLHEDRYREPDGPELDAALNDMAPVAQRGDWAQTLARYFSPGGTMEAREVLLTDTLARQGFSHVDELGALFARAEAAGFIDLRIRRRGAGFEAWLDRVERAERGEGDTPAAALRAATEMAERWAATEGTGG